MMYLRISPSSSARLLLKQSPSVALTSSQLHLRQAGSRAKSVQPIRFSTGAPAHSTFPRDCSVVFTRRTYATQRSAASIAATFISSVRRPHLNWIAPSTAHGAKALRHFSSEKEDKGPPVVQVIEATESTPKSYSVEIPGSNGELNVLITTDEELMEALIEDWSDWEEEGHEMTEEDKKAIWVDNCRMYAKAHEEWQASQDVKQACDDADERLITSILAERREDQVLFGDGTPLDDECIRARAAMHDAQDMLDQEGERVRRAEANAKDGEKIDREELIRLNIQATDRLNDYFDARLGSGREVILTGPRIANQ